MRTSWDRAASQNKSRGVLQGIVMEMHFDLLIVYISSYQHTNTETSISLEVFNRLIKNHFDIQVFLEVFNPLFKKHFVIQAVKQVLSYSKL